MRPSKQTSDQQYLSSIQRFIILLQRRNSLSSDLLANTQRLDPDLIGLLQCADRPNVGIRGVARAELAFPSSCPAALCVVTGPRIATSASSKYRGFACCYCRWWGVEYQSISYCRHLVVGVFCSECWTRSVGNKGLL